MSDPRSSEESGTEKCRFLLVVAIVLTLPASKAGQTGQLPSGPVVPPTTVLNELLAEEDTDGDLRITIEDEHVKGTARGDKVFRIRGAGQAVFDVSGTYYLSNLLQELKLAEERGEPDVRLDPERIFEPPADRISRMIREVFWDGLTRTIDEQGLLRIVEDPKSVAGAKHFLYVSPGDHAGVRYFSEVADRHPRWNIEVRKLPEAVSPDFVRSIDGSHGILALALQGDGKGNMEGVPFVVPGGRFNEMYGWDSYFITVGLLRDGRISLAQSMVDNFVYEINRYGAILNANRTYYLTRSQPPFLPSMIRAVYSRLPKTRESLQWLSGALEAAVKEYEGVWTGPDRLTATGLSRYWDSGSGPCPEVNEYNEVFDQHAQRRGMDRAEFERAYRAGTIRDPHLDAYFKHDRAMRESGHDTSYRLLDRCADLVTVDLNSLLYKAEKEIEAMIADEFGGSFRRTNGSLEEASEWARKAHRRKERIERYLWNENLGMYVDYDFRENAQLTFISAATFYPLWAGIPSDERAKRLLENALTMLEEPGGIVGSTESSRGALGPGRPERQWDYPYGWSPHQMLVWEGLRKYGYEADATRLAYKWLYTITVNAAQYNGTVPEKFDVVRRTHKVFAEYGNVGTTFSYITREGFGWTNASFQIGLDLLTPVLRKRLNDLVPPEWVTELRQ